MTIAIQILIAFILSNANPIKSEAREYLKKQLSGWKERVALAVFDAAWDAAMAAVGGRAGIVSMHAADELVAGIIEADKASVA